MQVYTTFVTVRDGELCYLIAQKNLRSRYWDNGKSPGSIVRNGPGSWCFIGGAKQNGESLEGAALRELREETGIEMETFLGETYVYIRDRHENQRIERWNRWQTLRTEDILYVVFFNTKGYDAFITLVAQMLYNLKLPIPEKMIIVENEELATIEYGNYDYCVGQFNKTVENSNWFVFAIKAYKKKMKQMRQQQLSGGGFYI